jgi:hypothetical protein
MSDRLTRNLIVALLGTPDHTGGNLNSPLELEEHGIVFNEKWIYRHLRDDPSGAPERAIYWHRYDFTGSRVCHSPDQEWIVDSALADALKERADRLALVESAHEPLAGNKHYRPASEVRDANDLGGYIEGQKE